MSQLTVKCPYTFEKNASTTNIHNMNEEMEKRGPQMNFNLFPIQRFVEFSRGATNRVKVFFYKRRGFINVFIELFDIP